MTVTNLELELQKVGFDAREASVYLASLELGPSPVQKIAQRAGIPRATVYLVLDDLQNKGVVTTYEEGKKTYYVAEPPQHIADLVEENALKVKQQQETIKRLIPELASRGQFEKGERPMIRYYEGPRALQTFIHDIFSSKGKEIINFYHLDRAVETLANGGYSMEEVRKKRAKISLTSRVIYTSKNGPVTGYSTKERVAKFIKEKDYPLEADISVRGKSVFLFPYSNPPRGVTIEDSAIANSLKTIFDLLWKNIT